MAHNDSKPWRKNRPRLGLNNSHVDQAAQIIHEVAGKHGATRAQLFEAFEQAGIPMGPGNGYHLVRSMLHAGTVVYGPIAEESNRASFLVMLAKDWLPLGTDLEGAFNGDEHAAITDFFAGISIATVLRLCATSLGGPNCPWVRFVKPSPIFTPTTSLEAQLPARREGQRVTRYLVRNFGCVKMRWIELLNTKSKRMYFGF